MKLTAFDDQALRPATNHCISKTGICNDIPFKLTTHWKGPVLLVASLFEADLFDFDDERLLLKLERLFGDDDQADGGRSRIAAVAPNPLGVAVSLTLPDPTE